jgi:hypothetical protein
MALLFVSADRKMTLLIWSFCCFYAPLPALGMFPYVVLKIPKELDVKGTIPGQQVML